jgi:hypothetical protein
MSDQYSNNPDDEREAAEDRIRRIRDGGGEAPPEPEPQPRGRARLDDDYVEDEPIRPRADAVRSARRAEDEVERRRAFGLVGAMVGVVLVVALLLVILWAVFTPGGLSLPIFATATPTPTPIPTATPTPTPTPTPTVTPTPTLPVLSVPSLECAFDPSISCADYCAEPANVDICEEARAVIIEQNADADYWFECVSSGTGEPRTCMEEAWRAGE